MSWLILLIGIAIGAVAHEIYVRHVVNRNMKAVMEHPREFLQDTIERLGMSHKMKQVTYLNDQPFFVTKRYVSQWGYELRESDYEDFREWNTCRKPTEEEIEKFNIPRTDPKGEIK